MITFSPSTTMGFNPRPREGGDPYLMTPVFHHARFNPRPREGGDADSRGFCPLSGCFNPRPREGGDALPSKQTVASGSFNPRPREGGDDYAELKRRWRVVSIHAPVKGATVCVTYEGGEERFQSTPP